MLMAFIVGVTSPEKLVSVFYGKHDVRNWMTNKKSMTFADQRQISVFR